jgi:AraC-like DNA-binding protein
MALSSNSVSKESTFLSAIQSTEKLVSASEHMARYKKLTAPEEIPVELDDEEFAVGFRWLLAVDTEPWTLTDYCFSWMRSLVRHGSGTSLNPLRVEYVQQRPNIRQVERSLGCEVIVGAARNTIIFRAADATKPFVTRNAELLDLLAPQFEEQLREYKEEDGFLELVRRTIQDRLTGHRPSITAVSEVLHMGPRTLQRRLHDSGSNFQRVLDEARHQMARYYLSNSALELNEAAYLLGFEDPNSFGQGAG